MPGRQRNRRGSGQRRDPGTTRPVRTTHRTGGRRWLTAPEFGAHVVLVAITVLVMLPVLRNGFTNWDDDVNVTQNPFLQPPLGTGLAHLWTHAYRNLYVPLVYTSFAMDRSLGGGNAFAFHLTNLLFHLASVIVLFLILRRLVPEFSGTANRRQAKDARAPSEIHPSKVLDRAQHGPSGEAASAHPAAEIIPALWHLFALSAGCLVFAIHPLQVEAVAWVTGRKDVMSGFLALLAIAIYLTIPPASAEESPFRVRLRAARYWVALAFFALSLLAKPATVTLPLALLAIEYYALRRPLRESAVVLAPWFVLAGVWTLVTAGAQVISPELAAAVPFWKRPFVAGWSLAFYAWKLLVPVRLAPTYGYVPWEMFDSARDFLALPVVLAVCGVVLWRRNIWAASLAVFIVFVLPVLGFLPFLYQIYSTVADRYVYLSMIGVSLAVATILSLLGRAAPTPRHAVALLAVCVLGTWGFLSFRQAHVWRDSESLWLHSVAIAPNVAEAHNNLGTLYAESGRAEPAMKEFETAIRLKPDYADAHNNIGNLKLDLHRVDEAIEHFKKAIERKPTFDTAWNNLGNAYSEAHRDRDAIDAYLEAVRLNPRAVNQRCNLALTYLQAGRAPEAEKQVRTALETAPGLVNAWNILGKALAAQGRKAEAAQAFSAAEKLKAARSE